MKFRTDRNKLSRAVTIAGRLTSTRSTLPILQNVLLVVGKTGLTVQATDLEQTVEVEVAGEVEEPGKLTVPARLLADYLQNNADGEIRLSGEDVNLEVASVNHRAQMKGLPAEDYPSIPQIKDEQTVELPAAGVIEAINHSIIASAQDDARPILNSLLWRFKGKTLTIVGTDGYRLACFELKLNQEHDGDYILPRKTMLELAKLGDGELITMTASSNQVKFRLGPTSLTSRILDGSYPAYEAIIPKKSTLETTVNAAALLGGLRLASLFSRDSAYSTKITFQGEKMVIAAVSATLGENSNEVALGRPAEADLTISVNAQYLIDALAGLSGEARLSLQDQKSPIVIRPTDQEHRLYLLMPLRSE